MSTEKNITNNIEKFLEKQSQSIKNMQQNKKNLEKIIKILIKARDSKKTIFTMGNGGSGSTASHFVSDLQKTMITKNHNRFKAISLVDNIPVILAWSNDVSFEKIFEEQLRNQLEKGDTVIAFSGSGKSKNVVNALRFAKKRRARCIGFTGKNGGDFNKICDVVYKIPDNDMLTIESQHVTLCHCIASTIRDLGKPMFSYE
ncbi:Phosphoheptose isomerase protein [Marine Group I thaumarchaeote SCGC AAA799-B03]|uniref:Phosphoheptose isomerase protein n=1 Tax=Marine Group I thaumarchaeote SCGC AAA799-B03 TaxID=1502289 RepID=A0A087S8U4_9ARCH|nr:Phosphoheptose isomerase protein [Marine Group I thaumarchaeote SCGC AAA799-B03]